MPALTPCSAHHEAGKQFRGAERGGPRLPLRPPARREHGRAWAAHCPGSPGSGPFPHFFAPGSLCRLCRAPLEPRRRRRQITTLGPRSDGRQPGSPPERHSPLLAARAADHRGHPLTEEPLCHAAGSPRLPAPLPSPSAGRISGLPAPAAARGFPPAAAPCCARFPLRPAGRLPGALAPASRRWGQRAGRSHGRGDAPPLLNPWALRLPKAAGALAVPGALLIPLSA